MLSELFIIAGILLLIGCLYLFGLFRKEEKTEFGVISKKISVINNIFHILIFSFLIGYCAIFYFVSKVQHPDSFIIILSQILFWGAVFVVVTIVMLKIMLVYIIKTKLNQVDQLTLLNTKMAGNCKIDELLTKAQTPIYLAILDLDNFKELNDIYGHIIGDEVLVKVAKIIKSYIREDEVACRFGGDEFVIGFQNREKNEVVDILEKIKTKVFDFAKQYPKAKMSVSAGLTCGVGQGAGGKNTYKEMMLNADKALYHVKKNGKDDIHMYSDNILHK